MRFTIIARYDRHYDEVTSIVKLRPFSVATVTMETGYTILKEVERSSFTYEQTSNSRYRALVPIIC